MADGEEKKVMVDEIAEEPIQGIKSITSKLISRLPTTL